MRIVEIAVYQLREAQWNPNQMDGGMLTYLRESIKRHGLVENLVVRQVGEDIYEVLSGNQRLSMLREMGYVNVPCVVVELDDKHARLLAQALNHIHGEDDIGLRAELLREVLDTVSEGEVVSLLPDTAASLRAIATMGQETMADYLRSWEQARLARLRPLHFRLTKQQVETVEAAISRMLVQARQVKGDSPNVRGTALYLLCKFYLGREDSE